MGLVKDGRLLEVSADPEDPPAHSLEGGHEARAADGTWVLAEVRDGGRARVVERLARPGTADARLYALLARLGPSPVHSPAALAQAAEIAAEPGIDDPQLDDLRHLAFVTIDEPTSRDLDQAVHVEARRGGFRLRYAIADAAHFVRAGTPLFEECLERGSTFYLPGLMAPMLPPILSEDLISLGPGVDRRALVFDLRLDLEGRVRDRRLRRARIRSRLKTSYRDVQAFFDGRPLAGLPPGDDGPAVLASVEALARLGRARIDLAEARDVVQVRRRELRVDLRGGRGAEGDAYGFVAMADPRNDAERFNEQVSLLCNVEGARLLASARGEASQPIFRFHRPPEAYRLRRLERRIRALVARHGLDDDPWRWRRGRISLADYLRRLPDSGPRAAVARAIHRQAMLVGGRSGFGSAPGLHYGIGAEAYARFTAPMREVVGIFVHKETWEHLGAEPAGDPERDGALRARVMEAADRSRRLQRRFDSEVNRLVLDDLFEADLAQGDTGRPAGRSGVILGISRSKVHVQLDDPPIDVKVYHRHLEQTSGTRLRQGRDGITLRRSRGSRVEYAVGDRVEVRALGHDAEHDRWHLGLNPLSP
ncbi:MAG: RNB domain-containing ribonuclease, partial [Holophagales bacterium]|nr:RNB domain-containing ribonuclease [Holophagales bacterium]